MMVVVAQLVELLVVVQAVVGSSPIDHPDIGERNMKRERLYTRTLLPFCYNGVK
ncbi:MAG: hypothetical protein G01um10148_155 [Parcubacteria group bacterium Gr01-1014_8]|nr:MAG: hypothetical protein G01um10148_155 [Parcubacteria group bacterium Gr01-1014_8]